MDRVDPVCGMQIDEEDAEITSQYKGQEFYFCSTECKQQFDRNPEQFARMTA